MVNPRDIAGERRRRRRKQSWAWADNFYLCGFISRSNLCQHFAAKTHERRGTLRVKLEPKVKFLKPE